MRRVLLVCALAAIAAAALPSVASAGQYSVWSCRDATGTPLSTDAWVPYGNVANPLSHSDTCAAGGWLGVQMIDPADHAGGSMVGYAFTPPRGTTIASYAIQMAGKTSSPIGGTHFELGLLVGGSPLVDPGNGCRDDLDPCLFGDYGAAWDAPANTFANPSVNTSALAFAATCTAPTACVVGADNLPYPAFGRLYRSEVVVDDPASPVVAPLTGTIADPGPIGGQRTVVADAGDVGGGVQRVELLVDGIVVDQAQGAGHCAIPYTTATPCPDAINTRFQLDTSTLANGGHSVVVRAVDAAGNSADSPALAVDVANVPAPSGVVVVPGPPVLVPAPPAEQQSQGPPAVVDAPKPVAVTLHATSARAKLPLGRRLRGTATAPDGSPQGGIQLSFQRRPFGGGEADWTRVGTTTTASDGSFRFPVVRQSGQIRVEPALVTVGGRARVVDFVAPIGVTLDSSANRLSNGDTVTLRGRVRGDGGAYAGRDALVQAIVRGRWRTIDTTEVGDDGRVTWTYRFAHTQTTADYRFRLRLPTTRALPWKAVTSDPVSVLVRGG